MCPIPQKSSPRSGKARRSPRQEKVRVPLEERSPVSQEPREERALKNKKEKIRRKNELMKSKKVSIRTEENCRCRWRVYGCEYSAPSGTTIIGHETSCVFKPDRMVGEICQILKNFQEICGQTIPGLDRILNPGSVHKMKPVEVLPPGPTLKSTPPRPVVFNSGGCWQNGPPTPGAMFETVLNSRLDSTGVVLHKRDIVTVARQIAFGDYTPENVHSIYDIDPASAKHFKPIEQYPMAIPAQLQKGELLECYPVFDATPRHTFTDLHVERGLSTMAIHEGDICNLWMLWPPTPSNEKVFHHHRCSDDVLDDKKPGPIFRKVVPMLTSGRMTIVKPGQAIYIPSGWIYSTLTLNGGYLPKLHMLTRQILPKTMSFSKKEVKLSTTEEAERSLNTLLDSVVALMGSEKPTDETEGLLVWKDILAMMGDYGHTWSDEIKQRTARIYHEYIELPQDEEEEIKAQEVRRLEMMRQQEDREWEEQQVMRKMQEYEEERQQEEREWQEMKRQELRELQEFDEEERRRDAAEWEERKQWMEREWERKKQQEVKELEGLDKKGGQRDARERGKEKQWEIRDLEGLDEERQRETKEREKRKQWEAREWEKWRQQEIRELEEDRQWRAREWEEREELGRGVWVERVLEEEELDRELEEIDEEHRQREKRQLEEHQQREKRELEELGKLIGGL